MQILNFPLVIFAGMAAMGLVKSRLAGLGVNTDEYHPWPPSQWHITQVWRAARGPEIPRSTKVIAITMWIFFALGVLQLPLVFYAAYRLFVR